jgi:hypothetical protein
MTRRLLLPALVAALAAPLPARAWFGDRALPPGRPVPGGFAPAGAPGPGFPLGKVPAPGEIAHSPVASPHPSGAAVIELLEDDAGRLARALISGGEPERNSRAGAWAGDCYSGASCLKVAGYQRYRDALAGWAYPVVGKPRPGEYRYLRFAWKKSEGNGVMLQLCVGGTDWGRYFSGVNAVGFQPALQLSPQVPREWTVVTRDLFADFGQVPFTLTGMAFAPMDGIALFDHVYLGRTIEDLDRVTNAAKEWAAKTDFLRPARLDQLWKDAQSDDAAVRQPAAFALGACGGSSVPYLADKLTIPDPAAAEKRIAKAIQDLDSARYVVREKATRELERFGRTAQPHVEAALKRPDLSPECRSRLEKLAADITAENLILTSDQRRLRTVIHVLELAETPAEKELLGRLSKANLEAGLSGEAGAALERVGMRGKWRYPESPGPYGPGLLRHQLRNRLPAVQDRHRPAAEVLELVPRVDAQVAVHGRQQVLWSQRPVLRVAALRVRRADHLAHLEAAAAHQGRHGVRPVVAAQAAVRAGHPRRPPELPARHDQNPLVQPAVVDVLDERRQRLVEERGPPAHPLGQVPTRLGVGVVVPAEVEWLARLRGQRVDRHHRRAGLGQPAGEQAALAPQVPAVLVAQPVVFLRQVERPGHARPGQDLERRRGELVRPFKNAIAVRLAAHPVEVGEQRPAVAQAGRRHAGGPGPARRGVAGQRRVAGREPLVA